MSILSFVAPIESVVPIAEDALALAALTLRIIGGLGALAAMLLLFRPLLTGLWHALLITVRPRSISTHAIVAHGQCPSKNSANVQVTESSITQAHLAVELPRLASTE